MADLQLDLQSEPPTPASGKGLIYLDTDDSLLSVKTEDGTVRKMGTISPSTSPVSEDAAATFTAAGDLQDTPLQINKSSGNISTPGRGSFDAVVVGDDPYDATGWDSNLEVPTKNAIRDKIETLAGNAPLILPVGAAPGTPPLGTVYVYAVLDGGMDAVYMKFASGATLRIGIDP